MDLAELYRDVIVDHNRRPRNFRRPDAANRLARGDNPLCGDQLTVYVELADGTLRDVAFEGRGCAISTASASLMTEAVKGRNLGEVETLFGSVHSMLTDADAVPDPALGKLAALSGVREFPARVKCASLCWHALRAALAGQDQPVSTE